MACRLSRRRRGAVASATVAILALAGCAGGQQVVGSSPPARGGHLVIARGENTETLDPVAAVSSADIAPIVEIFGTLYQLSDNGRSYTPSLAASMPIVSAAGTVATIPLRAQARFSNGSPLTSSDVKYSLDRARKGNGGFSFLLGDISSIATPTAHEVRITTSGPSPTLVAALGSWVASIVPNKLDHEPGKTFFSHPTGSGPFVLDKWQHGQFLRLRRNTAYWRNPKPLLDTVQWNTVPDANTRVLQVQAGQAQIASDAPFSQLSTLKSSTVVTAGTFNANYTNLLIFNEKVAPLADVRVRRAIAQVIDRKTLTAATLFGAGTAACSIVAPTMQFATQPSCLPYNVRAARSELRQSAYPHGFSVELTIDNLPTSSTIAQVLQAQLDQINIKIKIKVVDSGQLYTIFGRDGYQMGLASWASDIADLDEQVSFMLDPKAGGNSYYTGYNNPVLTSLIHRGRSTLDQAARRRIYARIQAISVADVPQLALSYQNWAYVWTRNVRRLNVNPMGVLDLVRVGLAK